MSDDPGCGCDELVPDPLMVGVGGLGDVLVNKSGFEIINAVAFLADVLDESSRRIEGSATKLSGCVPVYGGAIEAYGFGDRVGGPGLCDDPIALDRNEFRRFVVGISRESAESWSSASAGAEEDYDVEGVHQDSHGCPRGD